MRIKQLLTKTLLAAAGLCMGASAWAAAGDVTTNADIDFSNAITDGVVTGTVNSMTVGSNSEIKDGVLWLGHNQENVVTINEIERAGYGQTDNRDVVTATFSLGIGNANGLFGAFYLKDADGNNIAYLRYGPWNGGSETNLGLTLDDKLFYKSNNVDWAKKTDFTVIVDYKNKTISTTAYNNNTKNTFTSTVPLTNTNPVASFVLASNSGNGGDARRSLFDDLKIETKKGDYTADIANYTVKYVCGGSDIKDAEVRSGDVGSSIVLFGTDKDAFESEGKRYIYESDDLGTKTIAEDGTTVVTITFREAAKYAWTVKTSYDETVLPYTVSGSVWEDLNTVSVAYPRYQVSGTQLVQKAPNGNDLRQSITVTEDGFTSDFAYSKVDGIDNIYLLSEAEELGTGLSANSTSFTTRVSNGQIIYGSAGTLLTLPAGKYIFTLGAIGGDNNTHKVAYTVSAGSTQIASGTCTGNSLYNIVSPEFTLTGTTPITFTCSDPSSNRGIDLVYVQKTGDVDLPATVAATLGANGYSTFASAYDLDLSSLSGVKAYTATLSGKELSFTECTDKVVAGTGLLLKGAAGAEVELPVIATGAAAVAGNALTGVTAATELQSNAEGNYIFVMKKAATASDELTFLPLTTESAVTVPAGKAYVTVPASAFAGTARALSVSFDDETTGINNVVTTMQQDGIYSLSGQRVMQPSKGLYIMNGKKVIIK